MATRPDAELPRHRDGHRQAAALEAAGGQLRFIFDGEMIQPEVTPQARQCNERRYSLAKRNDRGVVGRREQFSIAPECRRAGSDRLPGHRGGDGGKVISYPERAIAMEGLHAVGRQPRPVEARFQDG